METGAGTDGDVIQAALDGELQRIVAKQAAGQALSAVEWKRLEAAVERPELKLEDLVEWSSIEAAAAGYGYSVRQIKNWKRDGRAAGRPAPLQRPADMPAWYESVYPRRQCPDRLRDAVERLLAGKTPERPAVGAAAAAPGPGLETGIEAALRRAREREAELAAELVAARERQEPNMGALETRYQKASEHLVDIEKKAQSLLEARGELLYRREVKAAVTEIAGRIARGLRLELMRRRRALQAAEGPEGYEDEVRAGIEEALRELCESRFADPLELDMAG